MKNKKSEKIIFAILISTILILGIFIGVLYIRGNYTRTAEADIQDVTVGNPDVCIERDVFAGTKLQKKFPESPLEKRESIEEKYQDTFSNPDL